MPDAAAAPGQKFMDYLLRQAGTPAGPQPGVPGGAPAAPAPTPPPATGIQDLTEAAAAQHLTGLQDVLTPSPRQYAAAPYNPSEALGATVANARALQSGIEQVQNLPRQLGEVTGEAGAIPPDAQAQ